MPEVARVGDTTTHLGGNINSGSGNTFVNGLAVARIGDILSDHEFDDDDHIGESIVSGSSKTFVNGLALARVGGGCSLGAVISSGSGDTFDG